MIHCRTKSRNLRTAFTIRVSPELHDKLTECAEFNERSLGAECTVRLRESFDVN